MMYMTEYQLNPIWLKPDLHLSDVFFAVEWIQRGVMSCLNFHHWISLMCFNNQNSATVGPHWKMAVWKIDHVNCSTQVTQYFLKVEFLLYVNSQLIWEKMQTWIMNDLQVSLWLAVSGWDNNPSLDSVHSWAYAATFMIWF